ncbi:undecaprenyl-diphosphate phosphatase [Patescibacteria group bacterium]|nr:undecaprenyl-diphosphate phosphatase [Patescibacteria group bacterium]MBU1500943.1 undecaprenyl-diphosphate phosphatase [Patescibacteria group bacterium]MBU2080573.1 undecaprenyl-diphosphate phosphatase [Patescibacteria group bacterium]MBU2124351.1 undecaprenyl-diphosphate phosphatase [Patescibacteria group bacterium]MBU2194477.1 undecaprenyl-diphosphate phosphatase [Patescibacteria group bacterium]
MTLLDSAILGVVEGITEFLPISSTGHLILTSTLLGLPATEFLKSFEIAIQLGAILAVVFLFWRSFLDFSILKKIATAFIPTAIIGLLVHDLAKTYLLGNVEVVVWALGIGGVALIVFELLHKEKEAGAETVSAISYKQAVVVGVFQACAIVPGVSRSAATIIGGLVMGVKRVAIVEFSFLLAVPVMAAATTLDLYKNASTFSNTDFGNLSVGFLVSFVVALFAIRFLLHYVRKHTFISFGIYRIVVALLFFVFVL